MGHCRARGTRLGCGRSWQVQWRSTGTADIAGVGVETIGAVAFRGALGAVLALAPEGEHTVGAGIAQVFARVVHRTPVGAGVEGLLEQVAAAGEPEVVLGAALAHSTAHTTNRWQQHTARRHKGQYNATRCGYHAHVLLSQVHRRAIDLEPRHDVVRPGQVCAGCGGDLQHGAWAGTDVTDEVQDILSRVARRCDGTGDVARRVRGT